MSNATTVVTGESQAAPAENVVAQATENVQEAEARALAAMTEIERMVHQAYLNRNSSGNRTKEPGGSRKVTMELFPTHIQLVIDGVTKNVALTEFREILSASLMQETKEIPAFQLPQGCFYIGATDRTLQLSCYYPENKSSFKHSNGGSVKKYNVPLPNIIISHSLSKQADGTWHLDNVTFWCTPKKYSQLSNRFINTESGNDETYILPFNNMYDNGTMCWGGNQIPRKHTSNLRGLGYFYDLISLSNFNNDMHVRSISGIESNTSWYRNWSEMESFPYERLRHVRSV